MLVERSCHASVLFNESIFVAGGQRRIKGKITHLDNVEKFDFATNKWHTCNPMKEKRSLFQLVCVGDFLYAIGGTNGHALVCGKIRAVDGRMDFYKSNELTSICCRSNGLQRIDLRDRWCNQTEYS